MNRFAVVEQTYLFDVQAGGGQRQNKAVRGVGIDMADIQGSLERSGVGTQHQFARHLDVDESAGDAPQFGQEAALVRHVFEDMAGVDEVEAVIRNGKVTPS